VRDFSVESGCCGVLRSRQGWCNGGGSLECFCDWFEEV
jgi:hypothetical protein